MSSPASGNTKLNIATRLAAPGATGTSISMQPVQPGGANATGPEPLMPPVLPPPAPAEPPPPAPLAPPDPAPAPLAPATATTPVGMKRRPSGSSEQPASHVPAVRRTPS